MEAIQIDRARFTGFLLEYGKQIITTIIVVGVIYVYFFHIWRRVPRALEKMEEYKKILNQTTLSGCKDILDKNYVLSDFYICSSYKTYLPVCYYYDYASIDAIVESLRYGARYIDLDIMNRDFEECTIPVVCFGDEEGQWQYTTTLNFAEVCEKIAATAFSPSLTNYTDPLFIHLNIKVEQNYQTINKIADIILQQFGPRLLPHEYSFQGRFTSTNIANTPIDKLVGKVIIIADKDIENTNLDELVNICPSTMGNFRDMTITQIINSYDPMEVREFNKRGLTRVRPDIAGRNRDNYNYNPAWYLGCQFICMNFTNPDEPMLAYIKRFEKSSLVLKPYKLRYEPILIDPPKPQDPRVDMKPKTVITPDFSYTY